MDEIQRRQWQDPEAVLAAVGVKPGYVFADIGCGTGFFALPAARLIGPTGKVYGVDINRQAIEELQRKAADQGLANLELKVGKAEKTMFCRACADMVFFGIVLHDFQDPAKVLSNARIMLSPGGKLANVDWKKTTMPFGPPLSIRFDEPTAARLIQSAGFQIESIAESGQYHYLIIAHPA